MVVYYTNMEENFLITGMLHLHQTQYGSIQSRVVIGAQFKQQAIILSELLKVALRFLLDLVDLLGTISQVMKIHMYVFSY